MEARTALSTESRAGRKAVVAAVLAGALLALLFHKSFFPGQVLFSNDGPLGRLVSQCHRMPASFTGTWQDLNVMGIREGGALPNITSGLRLLLGPFGFSKFYAPLALMILSASAWSFFRRIKLVPAACVLGGLAAMLNSTFFSAACWGVASQPLTVAMIFLALTALVGTAGARGWVQTLLAGFAVGIAVSEGADIGALFSLCLAVWILCRPWAEEGLHVRALGLSAGRLVVTASFAAVIAAQTLTVLMSTQVEGIAAPAPQSSKLNARWDWITQWSLPKTETLSLVVPGLFGYRMDSSEGANYWGTIGRAPAMTEYYRDGKPGEPPAGYKRFVGGGFYAGIPVVLLALWAASQAWRRRDSPFSLAQRRWIWFWSAGAFISLLLAFGRFAPFYRLLFRLPFFSSMRNPVKFLYPLSFALVVLFTYGIDALWRGYLGRSQGVRPQAPRTASRNRASTPAPAAQLSRFDRRWLAGTWLVWLAAGVGWWAYARQQPKLEQYLEYVDFPGALAEQISTFSVQQVGWFILFLGLTLALLTLVFRGFFTGRRARWGIWLVGALVLADLARADLPWIIYQDYVREYASNTLVDRLRLHPWEQRVTVLPSWFEASWFRDELRLPESFGRFAGQIRLYYDIELVERLFPYYNIQSLEIAQMARQPQDLSDFDAAFSPKSAADMSRLLPRRWQLTNARYVVGLAALDGFLNRQVDTVQKRFRVIDRLDFVAKAGIKTPKRMEDLTVAPTPEGRLALYEFTGALPRASLYSRWELAATQTAALKQLTDPSFAPEQEVLVTSPLPGLLPSPATNQLSQSVNFESYAPKNIVVRTQAEQPSVLLLNDRFDPNWRVRVDGHPAQLLRCNYLMQGVFVPAGSHIVQFRFRPPLLALYVSLAGIAVGLVCACVQVVATARPRQTEPPMHRAHRRERGVDV
jgi:hypothetical protein